MLRADVLLTLGIIVSVGTGIVLGTNALRDWAPWRLRCRYGLGKHLPVYVITSARLVSAGPTGAEFAAVNGFHRCGRCGDRLNEPHPTLRPL